MCEACADGRESMCDDCTPIDPQFWYKLTSVSYCPAQHSLEVRTSENSSLLIKLGKRQDDLTRRTLETQIANEIWMASELF